MLDLYVSDTCPYCKKVIDYFNAHNIKYNTKLVSDRENFKQLMKLGKIEQVPFLYDNSAHKGLYESDDIIKYADKLVD